jgi:hypothetical protein
MLNQMTNAEWLIWSDEHGAWWMPNASGYTRKLSDAGRYSLEQATKICITANRYSDTIHEIMLHPLQKL